MFTRPSDTTSPTFATQRRAAARPAGNGAFAGALATGPAASSPQQGVDAAGLFLLQQVDAAPHDGEQRRKRRQAVTLAGLDRLGSLQRQMLGGADLSLASLQAAAASLAEFVEGPDEEAGLCRAIALRLQIEIAKRQARS